MMAHRPFFLAQFYRVKPGDTGNKDIPLPADHLEEAVTKAGVILKSFHNAPSLPPQSRLPHHAQIVDENMEVLGTIRLAPNPKGGYCIERVNATKIN